MSFSMRLVPLALAAAGKTSAAAAPGVAHVKTRMRRRDLLARAVEALGGQAETRATGETIVTAHGLRATFSDSDGQLSAAFAADASEQAARELIAEVDDEYLRLVQEETYNRFIEGSAQAGMRIIDERVEDDNAIVMTVEVQA